MGDKREPGDSSEGELRATSDKMLAMLQRLEELEQAKRALDVGSDGFVTTADEVERLARIVFRWSQMQLQMAQEARRTGTARTPLAQVAPRPLDRILAAWREAQLRLEAARPGTPESEAAANDVERLREEFRANQEARH